MQDNFHATHPNFAPYISMAHGSPEAWQYYNEEGDLKPIEDIVEVFLHDMRKHLRSFGEKPLSSFFATEAILGCLKDDAPEEALAEIGIEIGRGPFKIFDKQEAKEFYDQHGRAARSLDMPITSPRSFALDLVRHKDTIRAAAKRKEEGREDFTPSDAPDDIPAKVMAFIERGRKHNHNSNMGGRVRLIS